MVSKKLLVVLALTLAVGAFTLLRGGGGPVEETVGLDPIAFTEDDPLPAEPGIDGSDGDLDRSDDDLDVDDGSVEIPDEPVVWDPPAAPRDPFVQLTGGVSDVSTIDDDLDEVGLEESVGLDG